MRNPGFEIIGDKLDDRQPVSIIVVGLGRGGTSAVAASLHALGISLGENYHRPNYEDYELAAVCRQREWRKLKQLVAKRQAEHPRFAWKLPDNYRLLRRIHRYFTNPYYIFVYRDIFAISMRRSLVHGMQHFEAMHAVLDGYRQMMNFARKTRCNALHVSYEKLITNRHEYAQALAQFCNVEANEENLQAVVDAIEPQPHAYVRWSSNLQQRTRLRAAGFDGQIDLINARHMVGWYLRQGSDQALQVEAQCNGMVIASAVCTEFRQDLIDAGVSSDGKAGFTISLADVQLKPGDLVQVGIKDEQHGLSIVYRG